MPETEVTLNIVPMVDQAALARVVADIREAAKQAALEGIHAAIYHQAENL